MDSSVRNEIVNRIKWQMRLSAFGTLTVLLLATVAGIVAIGFCAIFGVDPHALIYGSLCFVVGGVGSLIVGMSICCFKGEKIKIHNMISYPQHTVAAWTYIPNHDFQNYRQKAFGWSSPFMMYTYFNTGFIIFLGVVFWGTKFLIIML